MLKLLIDLQHFSGNKEDKENNFWHEPEIDLDLDKIYEEEYSICDQEDFDLYPESMKPKPSKEYQKALQYLENEGIELTEKQKRIYRVLCDKFYMTPQKAIEWIDKLETEEEPEQTTLFSEDEE